MSEAVQYHDSGIDKAHERSPSLPAQEKIKKDDGNAEEQPVDGQEYSQIWKASDQPEPAPDFLENVGHMKDKEQEIKGDSLPHSGKS
jgi:hypothetical protein